MVQLTDITELEEEVVEATQVTQPTQPIQTVETISSVEVLEIVNLLELTKDRSQFSYNLKFILNDPNLTPTNKSFLTTVADMAIDNSTFELITSDDEIAAKFNKSTKTVRRWITRSVALGKISKHIDYGTGKYCIRFLYNFLTNLSETQRLTVKVNIPTCPTKPTSTRTYKPKGKANNENTIIDQINNQNTAAILEAPTTTPTAASLQAAATPVATLTTPHLTLAPTAPGQAESSTSQSLSPLVQSLISSSTPLPTNKMLEQLSQAGNKIEPNLATQNNQTNVTSINSITSIKSTKPISSSPSNKNFTGVARTATFGNVLVAQKQATLLQEQLEQAEEFFYELTEEQQDLVLSINDSVYQYWQQTNTISKLETKWKQSRTDISFDDFLDESLVNQSKLLYRKQYTNFITTNSEENARELAINSLLEKWQVTSEPSLAQVTTQPNTNSDIIIKPSIQNISTTPEIITDSLDSFNQTQFDQTLNLDTPTLTINEPSSENIINQNVVSDTLTTQSTLDTFNQSDVSQNNQNPLPNSKNDLVNTVQSATNADNKSSNGSQNVAKDSVFPNSLKGDCFGQHCPTLNDTLSTTSTTPNVLSNTNVGTDNNTSFNHISSLLPATYSTDIPTSTISASGDNMPSATTVPNSSSSLFKALKLSSFLEDHDLDLKEEKKSFKASLTVSGTNNNSGTDASSTSTTANANTSSYAAIQKAKILSDLEATFGHRPSEVETITRGDENCIYCAGEGKLYKSASVLVSTNKGDKWETFRDQDFIPCQCGKLYDMLEFVFGNVVIVGIPKLTQKQLVMQQHLISAIDEKLKAKVVFNQQNSSNSVQPQLNKQLTQQPKIQPKIQVKPQAKPQATASNMVSDTLNTENNDKTNEDENNKPAKNYDVERVPLNKQMLSIIKKLNATAHERLDDQGNQDIVIKTTKKEDFCIVPNPCKQFRKSEFSFLEWLLYAAREPNRTLPVRMACQRYYLGKNEQEMITWKQQQAELNIGGSSSSND